jgi:hypothetical protein
MFGINQGVQPIIGYNYGARKYDRVKEALKLGIMAAVTIATVGFVATRLFPEQLVSIFNRSDAELIAIGKMQMISSSRIKLLPGCRKAQARFLFKPFKAVLLFDTCTSHNTKILWA